MAVIQYVIGYRSGAASNAPVASFYLADTYAELTASPIGDLAFAKDVQALFMATQAGWKYAYDGGGIFRDILIYKQQPRLILQGTDNPNIVARVFAAVGGRLDLSVNQNYNGSAWVKDDPNQLASLITMGVSSLTYYTDLSVRWGVNSDGSVVKTGNTYEYGRSNPSDVWTDIPFNSNSFLAGGGVGGVFNATGIQVFGYKLAGKSLIMNFWIEGTTSGNPFAIVHFYLPLSLSAARTAMNGAFVADSGVGPTAGIVYIYSGQNYVTIQKAAQTNFAVGATLNLAGQIEIPIA